MVPSLDSQQIGSSESKPEGNASNTKKTNVEQIEKIIGYISDEVSSMGIFKIFVPSRSHHLRFQFPCLHNNFSGTLYAGPIAIIFLGRIFFFEWTVVIKWEEVTNVQRTGGGIRIQVQQPSKQSSSLEDSWYDFEQVNNTEKAWASLVSLHNDSILDHTPQRPKTSRRISRNLRRMNSDPLVRISEVFDFTDAPIAMEETFSPATRRRLLAAVPGDTAKPPLTSEVIVESRSQESLVSKDRSNENLKGASVKQEWADLLKDSSYSETAIQVSRFLRRSSDAYPSSPDVVFC